MLDHTCLFRFVGVRSHSHVWSHTFQCSSFSQSFAFAHFYFQLFFLFFSLQLLPCVLFWSLSCSFTHTHTLRIDAAEVPHISCCCCCCNSSTFQFSINMRSAMKCTVYENMLRMFVSLQSRGEREKSAQIAGDSNNQVDFFNCSAQRRFLRNVFTLCICHI